MNKVLSCYAIVTPQNNHYQAVTTQKLSKSLTIVDDLPPPTKFVRKKDRATRNILVETGLWANTNDQLDPPPLGPMMEHDHDQALVLKPVLDGLSNYDRLYSLVTEYPNFLHSSSDLNIERWL